MTRRPISRLRRWVIDLCLVVPRSSLAYPFYIFASLVLVDFRRSARQAYERLAIIFALVILGLIWSAMHGVVSIASAFIELGLMLPVLFFVCGFEVRGDHRSTVLAIRLINATVFVLSIVNLFAHGFPHKIPYAGMSPDNFAALFGVGGARDVTILGFIGLLGELSLQRSSKPVSKAAFAIAAVNFLMPSYVIGIVCGLFAFVICQIRKPMHLVIVLIVALPSLYYALFVRATGLNHTFAQETGYNPKVLAFILIQRVYEQFPVLAPFGVGTGQFSSTPQTWEDPGLRSIAAHGVPHFPGLAITSYHQVFLLPYTSLGMQNIYTISSAALKPYNGMATLLIEWGIVGIGLLLLLLREAKRLAPRNTVIWTVVVFFLALNMLDLWIDSPWLGIGLLLVRGLSADHEERHDTDTGGLVASVAPDDPVDQRRRTSR